MKSMIFTLLLALACFTMSAQETTLYEENFDAANVIPEAITLINADGFNAFDEEDAVFNDSAWIVGTTGREELAGSNIAIALSYYEDYAVPADDWMILPAVTLGGGSTLSWDALSLTSSGNYPDDYQVLIAPAIADATPTVEHFESNGVILLSIAPENWSAAVGTPGDGLASREIDLAAQGYANVDVWVAFRLTTDGDGGSYLGIDNIKIVDSGVGINNAVAENLDAHVYPNPSNGKVNVALNAAHNGIAEIAVSDIIGRTVYSKLSEVNAGTNTLSFELVNIPKGVYVVSTTMDSKSSLTKLVIE